MRNNIRVMMNKLTKKRRKKRAFLHFILKASHIKTKEDINKTKFTWHIIVIYFK